jgi:predicted nucleic acid-binding protein
MPGYTLLLCEERFHARPLTIRAGAVERFLQKDRGAIFREGRLLALRLSSASGFSNLLLPPFTFVSVDNAIFLRSVLLPGPLHADTADRILIATAIMKGFPIVTKDRKIHQYSKVKSIW